MKAPTRRELSPRVLPATPDRTRLPTFFVLEETTEHEPRHAPRRPLVVRTDRPDLAKQPQASVRRCVQLPHIKLGPLVLPWPLGFRVEGGYELHEVTFPTGGHDRPSLRLTLTFDGSDSNALRERNLGARGVVDVTLATPSSTAWLALAARLRELGQGVDFEEDESDDDRATIACGGIADELLDELRRYVLLDAPELCCAIERLLDEDDSNVSSIALPREARSCSTWRG